MRALSVVLVMVTWMGDVTCWAESPVSCLLKPLPDCFQSLIRVAVDCKMNVQRLARQLSNPPDQYSDAYLAYWLDADVTRFMNWLANLLRWPFVTDNQES